MERVLSKEQIDWLVRIVTVEPRERLGLYGKRNEALKNYIEKRLNLELTPAVLAQAEFYSDGRLFTDGSSLWTAAVEQARKDRARAAAQRARQRKRECEAEVPKRIKR